MFSHTDHRLHDLVQELILRPPSVVFILLVVVVVLLLLLLLKFGIRTLIHRSPTYILAEVI